MLTLGIAAMLLGVIDPSAEPLAMREGMRQTPDSFELRVVAQLPFYAALHLTCGDADRDGMAEIYALGEREHWTDCILEHIGGYEFDSTWLGMMNATNWDIGDADRDGKTDLVVQDPRLQGNFLCAVESPDSVSLPDSIVWETTIEYLGSQMYATITDLDSDGAPELTIRDNVDWIVRVYENVADDSFALAVVVAPSPGVCMGLAQTDDLDGDGKPELAVGTDGSCVVFYEAVGDDTLELLQAVHVYDGAFVEAVVGAPDVDRDGKPEVLAFGVAYGNTGTLVAIESPCNDSFEVVWMTHCTANFYWNWEIAVGDIDGDSVLEFAVTDGDYLHLFRCVGNDTYEEFWQVYTGDEPVAVYDINGDGRAELIYRLGNETIIREYVELGVAELALGKLERAQVVPSVVRRGVAVRLEGLEGRFSVQVLDAAGRVVAEPEDGVWRTDGVSPGVYFFRFGLSAASCQPSAGVRKVLVVE